MISVGLYQDSPALRKVHQSRPEDPWIGLDTAQSKAVYFLEGTMDITSAVTDLAYGIRGAVRPHLGLHSSKLVTGKAESGDETFAIDDIAEHVVEDFIHTHNLPVAYYTEDRGFVKRDGAQCMLVIDPIDGTRPAMVGLEGAVVSIAVAPYSTEACMSDVSFGCVLELKTDRLFTASRGGRVQIRQDNADFPVNLTMNTDLDKMSWSFEIAGRPTAPIASVLSPLLDASGLRGGVFVINSIAFSLTRLVCGHFDAVIDVGNRILQEMPDLRDQFVETGLGSIIGLFPYDIAAAALIAETAGCTVTDAFGNSLASTALLDTSEGNISSCVAASNRALHEKLLDKIESGILKIKCNQ